MRLPTVIASLFLLVVVLSAPGGSHADTAQLKQERLRVPGRVLGLRVEDVNGDGKKDLVVAVAVGRAPSIGRRLAVFFDHGGAFGGDPDQMIEPPRGTAFVDLGDVDADGKRALLFADARGLMAQRLDASGKFEAAPRPLLKAVGLLALPDDDDLPFYDVMRDWDGDKKDEILLPLVESTALYTRAPDGSWQRTTNLRVTNRASYGIRAEQYEPRLRNFSARATFVVPELIVADYDGDGKPDLFAVLEDVLEVHKGGVPTVFSPVPVARHYLGVRSDLEIQRGAHVHTTVRDLDGDGVADLIVNKISGGLGQMRAQTGVYFGKKGGGYDPPVQVISREGFSGAVSLADLDGDGKPDLVMPHVSVGLGEMARALLAKKMLVGWEARRSHGRGFDLQPATVKDVDLAVDTSQLADVEGMYPSVEGDFDGDGKHDFVAPNGPDQIGVWLGGGKSLIADSPRAIVHATPSRFYQVVDLDGDRKSDLVVFYRGRTDLASSIVVLRNTGHGW
jgi:hypothetical protein